MILFDPKKDDLAVLRSKIIEARSLGHTRVVLHASYSHTPSAKQSIPSVVNSIAMELKNKSSVFANGNSEDVDEIKKRVAVWAQDSVGVYPDYVSFAHEVNRYGQIPSVKGIRNQPHADNILRFMRTCQNVFVKPRGNRTCFQICE